MVIKMAVLCAMHAFIDFQSRATNSCCYFQAQNEVRFVFKMVENIDN